MSATNAAKLAVAWIAVALACASARASDLPADHLPKGLEGVGFDQRLGSQVPLGLTFTDESGQPRTLAELVHGRPVVLTLNYFQCPMLCTAELNGLVSSLKGVSFAPGVDFDIVTVSIDPTEKPELARAKKAQYLKTYGRAGAENGWHFLTGDEASIRTLAESVGFRYRYDAESKQFAHAAGLVVLTPGGLASRYFMGVEFAPRDLRLALVESSAGRIGTLADKALLFCFHYDPTTTRYGFAALTAIRAAGIATVIALGAFVLLGNRRGARPPVMPVPAREVTHGV